MQIKNGRRVYVVHPTEDSAVDTMAQQRTSTQSYQRILNAEHELAEYVKQKYSTPAESQF